MDQSVSGSDFSPGFGSASVPVRNRGIANPEVKRGFNSGTLSSSGFHKVVTSGGIPAAQDSQLSSRTTATSKVITSMNSSVSTSTSSTSRSIEKPSPDSTVPGYAYEKVSLQRITKGHTDNKDLHPSIIRQDAASFASHSKRQLQKDGDASANVDKSIPIDKKNARKGSNGEEESTDSENDPEPISSFHRKLSTNKDIKNTASLKEGYLMKQTSSFQRWHRRYFKVKGRTLYYGKDDKAQIFDEIGLTELTIADSSSKHFKHCFQVITPYRVLVLAADDRTAMEEWIHAIRAASNANFYDTGDHSCLLSGAHVWYATSHARPTYCNICKEQLCGVTSHGLSCEICKFKAHKRCASKALNNCKWTTLASMGKDIVEEADGSLALPHQWLEGNLPVSAKCDVCEKTCGSVLRLQDWRCLWCRASVHTACRPVIGSKCPLGRISVVPPTALHTIGSDDAWEASRPLLGCSPLLVFVNSKSGDHQGLKFLRRFKQLLNPAQVFDLMNGGPRLGLQLFRHYEPFRILVCGGDGSVGWVMSEIDRLDMHRQCQVGVLPLGTGNDLARVLGWGAACDDDAHLPHLLEKYEKATTKMLDRWSIMTFERGVFLKPTFSEGLRLGQNPQISQYEDSVVSHLQNILQSNQHQTVISSAKVLCETVRDMIGKIGTSACDSEIDEKCATLSQKLDSLLQTLHEETENEPSTPESEEQDLIEEADMGLKTPPTQVSGLSSSVTAGMSHSPTVKKMTKFRQREALMSRANSLKKAVRQIIEHAEKTIDEQNTSPPVVIVRPMSLSVAHDPPQQRVEPMKYQQDLEDSEDRVDVDFDNSLDVESAEGSPQHEDVCDKHDDETSPLLPNDLCISPIDPHVTLPVPTQFADQNNASFRIRNFIDEAQRSFEGEGDQDEEPVIQIHNNTFKCDSDDEKENKVQLDHDQSEKDKDDEEELLSERSQLEKSSIAFPKIEVESPSSSSLKTPEDSEEFSISENYSLLNPHIKADSGTSSITISSTTAPNQGNSGESSFLSVPGSGGNFPRGASPRASRRISMGSLFKPLEVEIPKSPKSPKNPLNFFGDSSEGNSYSSAANSPFSSSAHSSPNKMSSSSSAHHKRKTLPIVNPLVSHPSWPAIAAGGVVSKVLLANADAICAVASPLMDPEMDPEELMIGFDERCVMNNYFGIGIDAKITLDFHLKREEHPKKCSSRTKNFMWYGVLGSKEFLQKSCKNLEQRVQLECDGKRLPLPSLQGIVILNIQSFMGGTNFWGGTKKDDCFLAPSFDDKILEVVAVFDSMQMAASRLINLQHHRIAQCHQIKITILGDEPIPVQVDGEAWLQPPGVIRIIHKNRMQMLCRNRALESSLKAWEEKQKHLVLSASPTDNEELEKKRHSKGLFKIKFRMEKPGDDTEGPSEFSDGYSEEAGSSDARSVEKWTGAEVGEWLEHLQLGEYRGHFFRHDIRGAELLSLQRRDLKELGVTKIGHLKRILQGIDNLQKELSISTANNKEVE